MRSTKKSFLRKAIGRILATTLVTTMLLPTSFNAEAATIVYTSGNYSMTFDDSDAISGSLRDRLVQTFANAYPKLVAEYNSNAPKNFKLVIDRGYDGAAYAYGGEIHISADYINSRPADTDCFTHEMMHLVQGYQYSVPGWLTEGIADYARNKFGLYNSEAGWGLPAYNSGHHYSNGYSVTASFLVWLEKNKNANFVREMDSRIRNGSYSDNTWNELAGAGVDQLWSEYAANPNAASLNANINSASGSIIVYHDINFTGTSASLGVGNYNLASLQAKGFANDALTSIKCPFGYKVTLYADDNFSGATKVVTADESSVGSDWNDKVSSIKVEKARYRIINRHSNLALDVTGANGENGTNVQQYAPNGTAAQIWEVSFNSDDSTYVITNIISGKALDMDGWSTSNGGNAHMWDNNNTANQRWYITFIDNGYTFLINKHSNKALDVAGWSTESGGNVHQWDYSAQANQQWKFELVN